LVYFETLFKNPKFKEKMMVSVDNSVDNDIVELFKVKVVLLKLSENDILEGKVISQDQLDENDLEWLKGL
jgi:hypothetical protein